MEKLICVEDNKKMMEFGVRIATHSILKQLNNGGHQTNLVLSPLSLHICLNLLAAGAKGPTLDQLLRFLNAENVAQLNAHSSLFMDLASSKSEPEPDSLNGSRRDESADETPSSGDTNQQLNDQPHRHDDSPYFGPPSQGPSPFAANPFVINSDSPYFGPSSQGPSPFAANPLATNSDSPFPGPPIRRPSPFAMNPFATNSDSPFFGPPIRGPSPFATNPFATNSDSSYFGPPIRGPSPFATNSDSPFFGTWSQGPYPFPVKPLAFKSDLAFKTLSRGKGPIISMVNGIWVDHRYSLKHSFKLVADDVYKAGCESFDFNKAEQVANEINAWAKKASKGHIDYVVSSDSLRGAALVLANALYFKGSWVETFEPSDTKDEYFHLLNGKPIRVPFMKKWHTCTHYKSFEDFKLVRMDYKAGEDKTHYAMYIFLPDRHDGLQELIQKFHSDPEYFTQNHELQLIELRKLWLPKLKFDYKLDVAENIKELGLDLPFSNKAELTEIVDEDDLYVSNVVQKSYIELNEEGTVAASFTSLEYCGADPASIMREPPSIDFVADHPFLFMIKGAIPGTVLFVGAALNPLM